MRRPQGAWLALGWLQGGGAILQRPLHSLLHDLPARHLEELMTNARCPKCGMELPEMLLAAHVEDCDEVADTPVDDTEPLGSIRDFIAENKDALDDDLFPDLIADERDGAGGVA